MNLEDLALIEPILTISAKCIMVLAGSLALVIITGMTLLFRENSSN